LFETLDRDHFYDSVAEAIAAIEAIEASGSATGEV
jgi:hypothetical protein